MFNTISNSYSLPSDRIGAVKLGSAGRTESAGNLRKLAFGLTRVLAPLLAMLLIAGTVVLARIAAMQPGLFEQMMLALAMRFGTLLY